MRVAAHLGVKDEASLLARAIDHLYSIGVDQVIATDMGSTDGSLEILRRYRDKGPLQLVELDDRAPDMLHEWSPRVTALVKAANVDWAIFLDADEFPLPATGSIKDCRALATADVLLIDRFNVPLSPAGILFPDAVGPGAHANISLIVEPIADFHDHLLANPDTPWIRGVPMPKALARPGAMASVTVGGHDVVAMEGVSLRKVRPADLVIAHLPFTDRSRFVSKVENVTSTIRANPSFFQGRIAWHWRRWLDQHRDGTIDAEFDRQAFSPGALEDLRAQGVIIDAASWFARQAGVDRPA
ncbi:MAG: hypothetical protein A3E01_20115 [Gammaproteobacteria bacterium RIFCSPHIGHO2_12_FULL_63_22]|nr:MAG: hypothetical protein A3E01_20115 [Gammaproteobacteria bacterium RIFCSPHIGHO2_12_FULL_63_22]